MLDAVSCTSGTIAIRWTDRRARYAPAITGDFGLMANCPCGCGVKVPFMKGGAAKAYRLMGSWIDQFSSAMSANNMSKDYKVLDMIRRASSLKGKLLDHIHGDAHPITHPTLLQLHNLLQQWRQEATAMTEAFNSNRLQADGLDRDYLFSLLRPDPILGEFNPAEKDSCIDAAISMAINIMNGLKIPQHPPHPIGSWHLSQRAHSDPLDEAEIQYLTAKKDGATDEEFRYWHDQMPIERLCRMALHTVTLREMTKREMATMSAYQVAQTFWLPNARVPSFGNPVAGLSDRDQPLAWELYPRVIKLWAELDYGRRIPSDSSSANGYFRSALRGAPS